MINIHRWLWPVFVVVMAAGSHAAPSMIQPLPAPVREGRLPVEAVLGARRSVREFRDEPLALAQVAQLLWAAQGVSGAEDRRTAPSAGALYPLELYVVIGRVENLPPGVYRYRPHDHALELVAGGDRRAAVATAAVGQSWIEGAPLVVVVAAAFHRTTGKYGLRGHRYAHMEAGGAGENLCLQAVALQLGATVVGAFDDAAIQKLLPLPPDHQPLALIPVGRPR